MTSRTSNLAKAALIDATVTATLIDAALHALDLGLAGWPEQTPGASPSPRSGSSECHHPDCILTTPCPLHDPDATIHLTATERLGTSPDTARRDLELLQHAIRAASRAMAVAARITHRWGLDGVTATEITEGLKERIDEMWCKTCAAAGISTVRRTGKQECAFCEAFRLAGTCGVKNPNNLPAPKALLDIHATRRLNSGDVVRVMTAEHGPGWNRKTGKKGKGRAA